MVFGMILWTLLVSVSMIGFGYIIIVLAKKETGNLMLAGKIIGWAVIILTAILLVYGLAKGPGAVRRGGMSGDCRMMKNKGMMDGKMMPMMKDKKMNGKMGKECM